MLQNFAMARPDKSVFAADFGRWITGYCTATLWYVSNLVAKGALTYTISLRSTNLYGTSEGRRVQIHTPS